MPNIQDLIINYNQLHMNSSSIHEYYTSIEMNEMSLQGIDRWPKFFHKQKRDCFCSDQ